MKPLIAFRVRCFLSLGLVLAASHAAVAVSLHGLFSDNMVLQRGVAVPVWGWAEDGEEITVQFRNQTVKTVAKGGQWMVRLKKLKAGGPDVLTVAGRNTLTLTNVLVGEVWVASGQSNMEWPLRASHQAAVEIPKAGHPQVRFFTVPKLKLDAPTNNVAGRWVESGPLTASNFSAVSWYFGRDLQQALGVPVGLIHTSWGGSPAEVWMSRDVLEKNARYKTEILDTYQAALKNYQAELGRFTEETQKLKQEGKTQTKKQPAPPFWKPTELYNGMIANLIPYAIKGAIWYQGESNAGRAHQYRSLFPDMIRNWRRDWGQGDFPFLAVQLAPWDKNRKRSLEEIAAAPGESDWAELREAQNFTARVVPNYGVAVITDVGDKDDIHPARKEPVGARLALAARRIAYGEKIVASGPTYRSLKIKGDQAILSFDNVGGGLEARDGELKGFAIAGEDRKFVRAQARIEGDKVVVSAPGVSKPIAVRYGWADFPVGLNLWNKAGLPASPFRTDDFPMVTAPKEAAAK